MKITVTFSEPPAVRCFDELLAGFMRAYRGVVISNMSGLTLELEVPANQTLNRRRQVSQPNPDAE